MSKLLEELSSPLAERFKDPLIGSFTLSYALLNWKSIIVLFSSLDANGKIYFLSNNTSWCDVGLASLLSIFFVFGWYWVGTGVAVVRKRYEVHRYNYLVNAENKKIDVHSDITKLNSEVSSLKNKLKEISGEKDKYHSEHFLLTIRVKVMTLAIAGLEKEIGETDAKHFLKLKNLFSSDLHPIYNDRNIGGEHCPKEADGSTWILIKQGKEIFDQYAAPGLTLQSEQPDNS